jgi:hypothetical protein
MFNLDQSIAQWRQQMLGAGIKAPEPLEELEGHLREEIKRQMRSGVSAQIAFAAAVMQIGPAGQLKAEFSKQRRFRDILEIELISKKWDMKWGPVLHLILTTGTLLFFATLILFRSIGFAEMTSSERASSLAAIALSGFFAYVGYFGRKLFPVIPANWTRMAIYSLAGTLVSLVVMTLLARANVRIEQLRVEFFWILFIPFGILNGLISGLEGAARKKSAAAGS